MYNIINTDRRSETNKTYDLLGTIILCLIVDTILMITYRLLKTS